METNRRALIGATAALAGATALNAAAIVAAKASGPQRGETSPDMPNDAEFRRLWAEYRERIEACRSATDRYLAVRRPYDEAERREYANKDAEEDYYQIHKRLWRKHKVEKPHRALEAARQNIDRTIGEIRALDAHSIFAISVKLCAIDVGALLENFAADDVAKAEAYEAVLADIARLSGGTVTLLLTAEEEFDA